MSTISSNVTQIIIFPTQKIMFPDQVVRAEMLLNTNKLTSIINQRQQKIIAYENIFAKHQDAFRRFHGTSKSHRCSVQTCSCLCCFKSKEPPTPQVSLKYIQSFYALPIPTKYTF